MSDYMPPEIITQILVLLDAKSIVRFSSVSKFWYSFITSREFISDHLKHALQESRIIESPITSCTCNFGHVDEQCVLKNDREEAQIPKFIVPQDLLGLLPTNNRGEFKTIGCIHGLVCIVVDNLATNIQLFILWNPSIRKFISLPPHTLKRSLKRNLVLVGFGEHFINGDYDYKVVRVLFPTTKSYQRIRTSCIPDAEVYSVRDKTWRRVKGIDIKCRAFNFLCSPTLVNETSHWIVFKPATKEFQENKACILAFSFSDELIREIPLPEPLGCDFEGRSHLVRLKDHLGVAKYAMEASKSLTLNVWILKDYKNKESWMRLHDFHVIQDMWHVIPSSRFVKCIIPPFDDEMDDEDISIEKITEDYFTKSCPWPWPMSFCVRDFMESIVLLGGHERVLEDDNGLCMCAVAAKISGNGEANGDQAECSKRPKNN